MLRAERPPRGLKALAAGVEANAVDALLLSFGGSADAMSLEACFAPAPSRGWALAAVVAVPRGVGHLQIPPAHAAFWHGVDVGQTARRAPAVAEGLNLVSGAGHRELAAPVRGQQRPREIRLS